MNEPRTCPPGAHAFPPSGRACWCGRTMRSPEDAAASAPAKPSRDRQPAPPYTGDPGDESDYRGARA